jgi:hypothetical protein
MECCPSRQAHPLQHRGSQYVLIKYTERLAEAGIEPSVDSVGASMLDYAPHHLRVSLTTTHWPKRSMALQSKVIHRCGPWRSKPRWHNDRHLTGTKTLQVQKAHRAAHPGISGNACCCRQPSKRHSRYRANYRPLGCRH